VSKNLRDYLKEHLGQEPTTESDCGDCSSEIITLRLAPDDIRFLVDLLSSDKDDAEHKLKYLNEQLHYVSLEISNYNKRKQDIDSILDPLKEYFRGFKCD
jgi:hypothetical protein